MIGIAIIGASRISGAHANAIELNKDKFAFRGIVTSSQERGKALTDQYGGDIFPDYKAALAREDVDAVVVGLPNALHAEVAIAAAQAGKHVLMEKPMALDLSECDAMIEAANKAGTKLMIGQTQHFFPTNTKAYDLLNSGEIGDLVSLTDTWYKPFGLPNRRPWFLDRKTGGGMLFMNGNHMIDRMIWLAGSPVKSVKAWVGNPLLKQNADDSFSIMMHHESGLMTTLNHSAYEVGEERWEGEAIGTRGMLKFCTFAPNQGVYVAKKDKYETVAHRAAGADADLADDVIAMRDQFAGFGDCIKNDAPEPVTPAHARHIMAVMLAAEASSREGREVDVSA